MGFRTPAECLAVLLACPASLLAQETLTLSQAVQQALARNRSVQAAHASVREADARVSQARAAYFPRVSFGESWQGGDQPVYVFSSLLSSRRFTAANFAIDSLNHPDPTGYFHGTASFEQIVFDGGRTGASVESAGLQRDIAALSADDELSGVAVAVAEAYGRALSARAARRAADASIAAAEEDLTRATLRRDAGTLSDADVLAVAVHLADARQRRIQAQADESIAKAGLNRLMGSPIEREYAIEEPAAATIGGREPASLPALFAEAESRRPDLKRAAASERLAEAGRRSARASWYPQVAAQGGVEADGLSLGDRATSWLVGGEVRWTFSTGGAEISERTAAAEAAVRARIQHEDARAAAQVDIASAVQQLDAALGRRDVAQASVEYARESQRMVRDRFEAGLASTSDLLRVAAAAFDAETQRASAVVDVIVSRAKLDRAVGRAPLASMRSSP